MPPISPKLGKPQQQRSEFLTNRSQIERLVAVAVLAYRGMGLRQERNDFVKVALRYNGIVELRPKYVHLPTVTLPLPHNLAELARAFAGLTGLRYNPNGRDTSACVGEYDVAWPRSRKV